MRAWLSTAEKISWGLLVLETAAFHAVGSVVWTHSVTARKAFRAALVGSILTAMYYFEVLSVVSTVKFAAPAVIGDFIGDYWAVKYMTPLHDR